MLLGVLTSAYSNIVIGSALSGFDLPLVAFSSSFIGKQFGLTRESLLNQVEVYSLWLDVPYFGTRLQGKGAFLDLPLLGATDYCNTLEGSFICTSHGLTHSTVLQAEYLEVALMVKTGMSCWGMPRRISLNHPCSNNVCGHNYCPEKLFLFRSIYADQSLVPLSQYQSPCVSQSGLPHRIPLKVPFNFGVVGDNNCFYHWELTKQVIQLFHRFQHKYFANYFHPAQNFRPLPTCRRNESSSSRGLSTLTLSPKSLVDVTQFVVAVLHCFEKHKYRSLKGC